MLQRSGSRIKSNPCKLCGSIYHTKAFCRQNIRKPIAASSKPLKRTPIKRVGKKTTSWLAFRKQWIIDNPGPYDCYICGRFLASAAEMTLDHIIARSRRPDLRLEPTNVAPCCGPCNTEKGSMGLEEFLEKRSRRYNTEINQHFKTLNKQAKRRGF